MEGPLNFLTTESKYTNGENSSYPASETGTNDGYDGSESGVEPDYAEWVFDSSHEDDILFDMSDEQAMAALRYFTSTAQRTNMLTKTHSNDLDLIAQLLSDKEKDLEMTAKIGQSLLQRNKQLMMKIEAMEDYLSQTNENAAQLEHDLQMKSKLVQMYTQDVEIASSTDSRDSKEDKGFDDQELLNLTNRCRKLEKDNQNLFTEALNLRQLTDEMEEKEETLVMDCIEQLAAAKVQITQLTDEIALKFEDNLQQQMEISKLINMVVELQKKQKLLVEENEELQIQLVESNENQENLREQLHDMQNKFWETKELMLEYQKELKSIRSRLDGGNPCDWIIDSGNSLALHDSLANEIEESVRRGLSSSFATEKSKMKNRKLLENVRHMNVRGSDTTSGRTSPVSTWSMASDERSESMSLIDLDHSRVRKPNKKLQIVKPMEGSDTLNKWHHLASKNIKGGLDISSEETHHVDLDSSVSSLEETDLPMKGSPESLSVSKVDNKLKGEFSNKIVTPVPRPRPDKASSPRERPTIRPRGLSEVDSPQKKTIITRNSTALKSLRQGRSLLKSDKKGGRSQADVIGMIATAMGKVNVEPKAEQRILSSLNSSSTLHERESSSPVKADFTLMPNVAKALEKAANLNNENELNDTSEYENWTDDNDLPHSISESNSVVPPSQVSISSRTAESLHSISGPLGLLNRANPSEPDPDILNNLLRYSGSKLLDATDIGNMDSLNENSNSKKSLTIRSSDDHTHSPLSDSEKEMTRSYSAGSLVNIIANNRRKSRPLGLSNLVSIDSPTTSLSAGEEEHKPEAEIVVNKDRTKQEGTSNTSISEENGLDKIKEDGGGLFGFFSFLGR